MPWRPRRWSSCSGFGAPVAERHFALLRADAIFAPLSLATLERLTHDLIELDAPPGQEVITQGDVGDRFYLIEAGEVEVLENDVHRCYQRAGESFGEIALLRRERRTATVTGHRRSSEAADDVIDTRLGGASVSAGRYPARLR